jgi:hypothetical protein
MKKKVWMSVTVFMVVLALSVSVQAGPLTIAEGDWLYMPTVEGVRIAGGNTFLELSEVGEWSGTFDGDSTEVGTVVQHSSGLVFFKGVVSFVGTVNGQSGTMKMSVVGSKADPTADWEGKWVILGGTEGLATLQGQGTWWGPGWSPLTPTEWGVIHYAGNVHFEP